MNISDPAVRRYVYGIVATAIPLLVIFGLITPDQVQLWLNLAAAALGLGSAALALPNTPKSVATESEAVTQPSSDAPRHSL